MDVILVLTRESSESSEILLDQSLRLPSAPLQEIAVEDAWQLAEAICSGGDFATFYRLKTTSASLVAFATCPESAEYTIQKGCQWQPFLDHIHLLQSVLTSESLALLS